MNMKEKTNNVDAEVSNELLDMLSSKAENVEKLNEASDVDPLDIEYHVGRDNDIREIVLQLTAGGPKIDLYVNKSILEGSQLGERQRVHVQNDLLMEDLKQLYESLL